MSSSLSGSLPNNHGPFRSFRDLRGLLIPRAPWAGMPVSASRAGAHQNQVLVSVSVHGAAGLPVSASRAGPGIQPGRGPARRHCRRHRRRAGGQRVLGAARGGGGRGAARPASGVARDARRPARREATRRRLRDGTYGTALTSRAGLGMDLYGFQPDGSSKRAHIPTSRWRRKLLKGAYSNQPLETEALKGRVSGRRVRFSTRARQNQMTRVRVTHS